MNRTDGIIKPYESIYDAVKTGNLEEVKRLLNIGKQLGIILQKSLIN